MRAISSRVTIALALVALAAAIAGCSNNKNNNAASNTSFNSNAARNAALQPSLGATVAPAGTAGAQPIATVAVSPSALAAAGAQQVNVSCTDSSFSPSDVTVQANKGVALTLSNRGTVPHVWHLTDTTDVDGKVITTPNVQPGQSATIDFVIKTPGTYHFQDDTNPAGLRGTLTVQ